MTPPNADAALDERYGRGRARRFDRRIGWAVAVLAIVAGLIVLLFSGWLPATNLQFRELSYEVVDDRTVHVSYEVTAPPGSEVVCALEALSSSYAQVGWKLVELPIAEQHTRQFTGTLVTTYPATTGLVKNCWLLEPEA